jgi:hypothetical protein
MALESLPKIAPALFSAEQDLIQIYNKKSDTVGTINASLIGTPPSGVAGAIQFSNGSAFASDAANLFWDDTNNRLGVGTNAPSATAHFKGSGSTSATTSLLIQNSAGTAALQVTDDNKIAVGNTIYQSFTSSLTNVILSTHTSSSINNTGIYAPGGSAFGVVVNGTRKAYVASHWQMNGGVIAQGDGTFSGLDNSAILEAISTTKGFLPPRMTTAQKLAIATPANGLMVFDTDLGRPCFYNGAWVTL